MTLLNGIPESMLIPLAYRATETNEKSPIIADLHSQKIFKEIDYPFEKISNSWPTQVGISVRTYLLDQQVSQFLKHTSKPLIINIGCGLDTRRTRLELNDIPWIDLDVPEVIDIRKQFFSETSTYKMIAKSMLDDTWMDDVQKFEFYQHNMEILIIFEGVLMYFDAQTITQLLNKIISRLKYQKLTFAIEFCSQLIAKNTHRHKAVSQLESKPQFKFGYNRLSEVMNILPLGLSIETEYNYFDYFTDRWRLFGKCRHIPYLKNRLNNKIVILQHSAPCENKVS